MGGAVSTPKHGRVNCGCLDASGCLPGHECLPSDYVAPCPEGTECLPSNYIDPDTCPGGGGGMLDDPSTIADLAQWYDAADPGTITLLSGTDVDAWADKSGNAHDLTAYQFDGDRPTLISGALSGLPVIADTGSNMFTAAYARSGVPLTVFAVASWDNAHGLGSNESAICATDINGIIWRDNGSAQLVALGGGGGDSTGTDSLTNNVPHLVTVQYNDPSSSIRVDAVELSTADLGSWDQNAFYIFGDSGANRALRGYIAELLVYDRALTADEIASVEDYLLRKWFHATNGVVAAYVPYAINAHTVHPADVDATILARSPWGYWKMDDVSGNPQDSSGNGHHATGVGASIAYSESPLTSKVGNSLAITSHTSYVQFPVLVSKMSDYTIPFTLMGVTRFDDDGTPTSNGVVFLSELQGSGASMFGFYLQTTGDMWLFINQAPCGSMPTIRPVIGEAFVWAVVANGFDVAVWINGVLACTGFRLNASYSEVSWAIGVGGFFTNPAMHISNIAAWDSALAEADIIAISEALLDDSILATAYRQ